MMSLSLTQQEYLLHSVHADPSYGSWGGWIFPPLLFLLLDDYHPPYLISCSANNWDSKGASHSQV